MRAEKVRPHQSGAALDLKIVVLGSAYVGKTSIINRYCNSTFTQSTLSTVGAGFFTHSMFIDNTDITIMLWDTAGEERFRSVTPALLRGAHGMVLAFDLSEKSTFDDLDIYLDLFLDTCKVDVTQAPPVVLIGNKADLPMRAVSQEMIDKWKQKNRIAFYYPASAKSGSNVEEAMNQLIKSILSPELRPATPPIEIVLTDKTQRRDCCQVA
jgi:small GTP-binding protein